MDFIFRYMEKIIINIFKCMHFKCFFLYKITIFSCPQEDCTTFWLIISTHLLLFGHCRLFPTSFGPTGDWTTEALIAAGCEKVTQVFCLWKQEWELQPPLHVLLYLLEFLKNYLCANRKSIPPLVKQCWLLWHIFTASLSGNRTPV